VTAIELVIFDCDGVLVDSEPIALRVNVESFAEFGHVVTEDTIIAEFLGRSNEAVLEIAARWIGPQRALEWNARFRQLSYDALAEQVEAVDGIVQALDRIDLPVCVASSGTKEKMKITLGRTGLYQRFEGRIFSVTEVANGKPEPDLFLHAAFRLGVPPEACAVVEDSQYGVQAARAAGMRAFGYAGGVTPAAWLEGPGTTVFHDMRELPALLKASRLLSGRPRNGPRWG
jgi:HAD superfamily hydrolase (TIGR01509 family)